MADCLEPMKSDINIGNRGKLTGSWIKMCMDSVCVGAI